MFCTGLAAQIVPVTREHRLHQVLEATALGKRAGLLVVQIRQGFVGLGHGASVALLLDSIWTQGFGQTLEEFN